MNTSFRLERSQQLMARARTSIPGGVNSPVRAFRGVGGTPVFFRSGQGPCLTDEDGNHYIDYVGSWGPMILGHAPVEVIEAVQQQAAHSLGFGAPTEIEIRMAEKIVSLVPGIEQVRMVNSGTEATMSAIRLARGFTGRDLIVKFEGCYHGHSDSLLVKAGSGLLTLGIPNCPGIPEDIAHHTMNLRYNDGTAVEQAFAKFGDQIAAVIVEPVAGNMGCIPPVEGFLAALRHETEKFGALLIFDEVMTGFRVALGGAQEAYGIQPDLTTLGKVIGGGLPVGAFGGRKDIMAHIAPLGPVYQAGTLSGNPLAVIAGLTTLEIISRPGFYTRLDSTTADLVQGLVEAAEAAGIALHANRVCGMFGIFFTEGSSVNSYEDVAQCKVQQFNQFFHLMLERGVYLAPSAFEAGFVSSAHQGEQIDFTLAAAREAFLQLATA